MNGHIILPDFYRTRWTDDYKFLFDMVGDHYGFSGEYNDNPIIKSNMDVVILFATPHHARPLNLLSLSKTNKRVKLIGFMKDIQYYGKQKTYDCMRRMFDRYDVILSPANELFKQLYPEYVHKMIYFPDFFGPYERYDLPVDGNPVYRALLNGSMNPESYPLRNYILQNMEGFKIDYLESLNISKHPFVGNNYAKLLNKYFCCITCASVFNYTLAKYWEIPAAGSLLIANTTNDLESLGMVPGKHFVKITYSNALGQIKDCIEHPDNYLEIRKTGTEFVRQNHSIRNRFDQLKGIIDACIN